MPYLLIIFAMVFAQCETKEDNTQERNLAIAAVALSQQSNQVETTLNFEAYSGSSQLACGSTTYTLPSGQVVYLRDLRFYVSSISLVKADGSEAAFTIYDDSSLPTDEQNFQVNNSLGSVALLDFADNTGSCTSSSFSTTSATRTSIKGTVASGSYTGVKFTIGVPSALNHYDSSASTTPTALNTGTQSGMQWSWLIGYKFMKLELQTTSSSSVLNYHLGSTNCSAESSDFSDATCQNSYRSEFTVQVSSGTFEPSTQKIRFDLEQLVDSSVLTSYYADGTALACMPIGTPTGSGGTSTSCSPLIRNIGLTPGDSAGISDTTSGAGTVDTSNQKAVFSIQ